MIIIINYMDKNNNFILLGGDGFLGQGLQDEFRQHGITFSSLDIAQCDLSLKSNIPYIKNQFQNYSNIVLLASKIGAKLFQIRPQQSADENQRIFDNVISAIIENNQPIRFSYYSTCEIFGSRESKDDFITERSSIKPLLSLRRLYSYVKYQAELKIIQLNKEMPNIFTEYKIFRPFNVSGKRQKRGVIYDMVRSAVNDHRISYSANTTRTFTSVGLASRMAYDKMMSPGNVICHLVDAKNSIYMKTLASLIVEILESHYGIHHIQMVEMQPDKDVQFRNVDVVDKFKDEMKSKLVSIISDILNEESF